MKVKSMLVEGISHCVDGKIPFPEILSYCGPIHGTEVEDISSQENPANPLFLILPNGEEVALEFQGQSGDKTHIPSLKDEIVIPSITAEGQIPNSTSDEVKLCPLPLHDSVKGHQYSISIDPFAEFVEFEHRECRVEE